MQGVFPVAGETTRAEVTGYAVFRVCAAEHAQ